MQVDTGESDQALRVPEPYHSPPLLRVSYLHAYMAHCESMVTLA